MNEVRTPPRVSVIMPFLNQERFIEESIESVLAQTRPDWELLLIDDGSTDRSTGIALDYAAIHPDRIRYLDHPNHANKGASASRNLGIRQSRGDYIALLDADDVWLPNKLEQQIPLLESHPQAGSVYARTLYWYSWEGEDWTGAEDHVDPLGFPPDTILDPPALLMANLKGRAAIPCTCSLLIRRSVVTRIGGFEEVFRRVFTDQVFYAKLFLEAPVLVADACWDKYRQHRQSSCAVADETGELDAGRRAYLTWFARYLQEENYDHPDLERIVRKELWYYDHPDVHRLVRAVSHLYWQHLVPVAFRTSRVLLPDALRQWLWRRWAASPLSRTGGRKDHAPVSPRPGGQTPGGSGGGGAPHVDGDGE